LNAEGRTIIMVTHDDAVAHRAHRVVRLLDGGIQSDEYTGSPGSLELASAANARK